MTTRIGEYRVWQQTIGHRDGVIARSAASAPSTCRRVSACATGVRRARASHHVEAETSIVVVPFVLVDSSSLRGRQTDAASQARVSPGDAVRVGRRNVARARTEGSVRRGPHHQRRRCPSVLVAERGFVVLDGGVDATLEFVSASRAEVDAESDHMTATSSKVGAMARRARLALSLKCARASISATSGERSNR